MVTLITYDISNNKIRARVHKFLKEFGINTQKSVFECDIDDEAVRRIREFCRVNIDLQTDSVRIYRICERCMNKVVISGRGIRVTCFEYLVV